MKKFNDLFIRADIDSLKEFEFIVRNFKSNIWQYRTDGMNGIEDYRYIIFRYLGKELPKADVFIFADHNKNTWCIGNIVPVEKGNLSFDEYNGLLDDFYHNVLENIEINGLVYNYESNDNYDPLQDISEIAFRKLKAFSDSANKSTGSIHPCDRERWFDFICTVVAEERVMNPETLNRYLNEDLGWEYKMARELCCEYEFGIELIEHYIKNFGEVK